MRVRVSKCAGARFDAVDIEIHSNDCMTMASDLILNYTKFDYKTVMSPFTGERQRNQEPSIGNYRDITIDKNNTATIKYYTERDKYK